jgi:hypothetical protein
MEPWNCSLSEKPTCLSCGIKHSEVEANGVWFCPNALCKGMGALWFRSTLDSFKNHHLWHTVDENERLVKGKLHNKMRGIEIMQKVELNENYLREEHQNSYKKGYSDGYEKACLLLEMMQDQDLINEGSCAYRFLNDLFEHLAIPELSFDEKDDDEEQDGSDE